MSLRAMLSVFDSSEATLANRLVLLALADNAHDDGSSAHPSIRTLARKAKVDKRTAQRALRALEALCEIVPVGVTSHGVTIYHLTVVTPTWLETGIEPEGGAADCHPTLMFLLDDSTVFSSGGRLPGEGAANCHPPDDIDDSGVGIPYNVQAWIGKHGLGFPPDDARSILEDNFKLRGTQLERAVNLLDQRRRRR